MTTIEIKLGKRRRLSQKAATVIVRRAEKFSSNVLINMGSKTVNARSLMGMISLGELSGTLRVCADGRDEDAAVDAVVEIIGETLDLNPTGE